MHKNGKWAKQIIDWQNDDGSWGDYHSLAVAGNSRITTEQAVRRLERLGYTIDDECIQKAVQYMSDCLDEKTECAFTEHILNFDKGIYYIYEGKLTIPPQEFQSKNASRYLGAIELIVRYRHARHKLKFVTDWLNINRNENGKWDMGKAVNDKLYFPLSDDWRKSEIREADCTERVAKILNSIT